MKKSLQKMLLSAALAMTTAPTALAEEPLATSVPRLSMETALKMAQAAVDACRKEGISISATVVDRSGLPQVQLRDTVAPPVSWSISYKKAYTAVMFNMKGTDMEKRMKNSPLNHLGEGLAFMGGSVPIAAGGRLYGAIGVSGAPSGEQDEKCARAGLEAVIDDLEMM